MNFDVERFLDICEQSDLKTRPLEIYIDDQGCCCVLGAYAEQKDIDCRYHEINVSMKDEGLTSDHSSKRLIEIGTSFDSFLRENPEWIGKSFKEVVPVLREEGVFDDI